MLSGASIHGSLLLVALGIFSRSSYLPDIWAGSGLLSLTPSVFLEREGGCFRPPSPKLQSDNNQAGFAGLGLSPFQLWRMLVLGFTAQLGWEGLPGGREWGGKPGATAKAQVLAVNLQTI